MSGAVAQAATGVASVAGGMVADLRCASACRVIARRADVQTCKRRLIMTPYAVRASTSADLGLVVYNLFFKTGGFAKVKGKNGKSATIATQARQMPAAAPRDPVLPLSQRKVP